MSAHWPYPTFSIYSINFPAITTSYNSTILYRCQQLSEKSLQPPLNREYIVSLNERAKLRLLGHNVIERTWYFSTHNKGSPAPRLFDLLARLDKLSKTQNTTSPETDNRQALFHLHQNRHLAVKKRLHQIQMGITGASRQCSPALTSIRRQHAFKAELPCSIQRLRDVKHSLSTATVSQP